jgi:hypothetical protein
MRSLLVLLASCLLLARAELSGPCDDSMNDNEGHHLEIVPLDDTRVPAWVAPMLDPVVRDPEFLDDVFSFPEGTVKTGCTLSRYTLTKLCVPRNGTVGGFRAKALLQTNCGLMNVKMRIGVRPKLGMWGRSAS